VIANGYLFTNKAASAIGVPVVTLKHWLSTGKVPDVSRNANGWRLFSPIDIERIRKYAELAKEPESADRTTPSLFAVQTRSMASFFSGIGGFDLGFEQTGFRIVLQCEIEPFCKKILEKRWPTVKRFDDIRRLRSEDIPPADVWVAGFPCQDLSLARMGKRDGLRGSKSGLFYEFVRLVGECLPRVLLLENVAGILNSHNGKDFGIVISSLAELGYAVGWRTFNSRYFGVPQSRQRVYIVGCRGDRKGPGSILFEPKCGEGDIASGGSNEKKFASPFQKIVGDAGGAGPVIQSIAYCLYATSARHTGTDWSRNYVCYPKVGKIRRLMPSECEGVMSFPTGWTYMQDVELTEDDLDSARYHALGNAVTPPVSKWIAQRISAYLAVDENQAHTAVI
jgi:DNA (cytosine-5)-methyltransferase 1